MMKLYCCKKNIVENIVEPVEKKQKTYDETNNNEKQSCQMKDIERVANIAVKNNWIAPEEAKTQVNAIQDFYNGKLSYAEMRALAG